MRIYELERYVERLESRLSVAEEDCADALKTVDALRDDLAASENEIVGYQRAAVESEAALAQATERAESLSRELLAAIQARDSYRASAELRVGMRREFEALLGVRDTTDPDAFEDGLIRLRELLATEAQLVGAATEALDVLTRLADSAAYWSEYDVPVGIVAEIDSAKARLAGALSREARP